MTTSEDKKTEEKTTGSPLAAVQKPEEPKAEVTPESKADAPPAAKQSALRLVPKLSGPHATWEERWAVGRRWEELSCAWLKTQGYLVLPTANLSKGPEGAAPAFEGANSSRVIVPDILACRDGKATWMEVKMKEAPSFTRMTSRWETGIPERMWQQYLDLQQKTGIKVTLLMIHTQRALVHTAQLDDISRFTRLYAGNACSPGGMRFLPYDMLTQVSDLESFLAASDTPTSNDSTEEKTPDEAA
jgi:hypothetical protein